MAITQWQLASKASIQAAYFILHDDDDMSPTSELVSQVVTLLNIDPKQIQFAEQPVKGAEIIWDMRQRKSRPHHAWIESVPMQQLITNSEHKRSLWQQICQFNNKKQIN